MKRWIAILIPVIILAYLIVWRITIKNTETAALAGMHSAKGKGPVAASVSSVQMRDIVNIFEAAGSLEAPLNVQIAPKITGRIVMLNVREGDPVHKGQVLVGIDASDVEANVQQQMATLAEAQYKLAQAILNQNPADVAVNTQILQQKASVASAKADVKQAEASNAAQLAGAEANIRDAQSKIDNANSNISGAQANLDNARTKFSRVQSLFQKGFVATQVVDDARAALAVQESALQVAKGQLASAIASKESIQQQYNVIKAQGEANIEAARAKATQANASLTSANANTSQKSAYRQSIAALKAEVDIARASLSNAKAKRADAVLISPLDGYVTQRLVDPGAIASPNQPILSVQFMKQLWVTISVPEEISSNLHIGQPVKVQLDAEPGKELTANIIQINPAADPQSRQFQIRVIMSNTDNQLKPGMFAHVTLEIGRIKNAIVVPREAVLKDQDGNYVMTVDAKSKAVRVPVVPSGEDESYINIGNALKPGQKVIVMSSTPVREGQTISTGGRKGKRGGAGPGGGSESSSQDQGNQGGGRSK